jgi:hypothetical protein
MAGSDNKNDIYKNRIAMREAILTCLIPEDIADLVRNLIDTANNPEERTVDRINATKVIFDYAVPKPRQELDITSDNKGITGYTFEVVKANEQNS